MYINNLVTNMKTEFHLNKATGQTFNELLVYLPTVINEQGKEFKRITDYLYANLEVMPVEIHLNQFHRSSILFAAIKHSDKLPKKCQKELEIMIIDLIMSVTGIH